MAAAPAVGYLLPDSESPAVLAAMRPLMLGGFVRTLVKVAVASLIVGTILAHFGISAEKLIREAGATPEQITELGRRALDWALPNVLLGSLVIVPVWFIVYLFRPPGARSD